MGKTFENDPSEGMSAISLLSDIFNQDQYLSSIENLNFKVKTNSTVYDITVKKIHEKYQKTLKLSVSD